MHVHKCTNEILYDPIVYFLIIQIDNRNKRNKIKNMDIIHNLNEGASVIDKKSYDMNNDV